MAPTSSSLGDSSGLKGSKPPGGASYARAGTHAGKSFMLSGAKMATNDLKMKVSVPFTADDSQPDSCCKHDFEDSPVV
jgi:hypothetical protein